MERVLIMIGWLLVIGLAAWLRLDDLGDRPFHADEATGARITARRMSGEGGAFDPTHYHGPVLGDVTAVVCRLRGEDGWTEMTKTTLRLVPVGAGLLVVLLPLCWRRMMGDAGVLCAGALLAASPLLVYYSRMFIHEMLLVLAGGAFLACFSGRKLRPVWAGLCLGLMFAIKETFVISVLAWGGAWLAAMATSGRWNGFAGVAGWLRERIRPLALMAGVALMVSMLWYTRLLTHPVGAWHAVQTFFVYETVDGHEKPWWWYLATFCRPEKQVGRWWIEGLLPWLALLAFAVSWVPFKSPDPGRLWMRFLGFAVLGHAVIYSLFAYKTPWLLCLPWLQVGLLAGFCLRVLPGKVWPWLGGALVVAGLVLPMERLARFSSGRLSSDARNRYAYVPTRKDIERVEEFLNRLRPLADEDSVAVVGSDYWPLPWYLRSFARVGYWPSMPDGISRSSFVMVLPDASAAVMEATADTHTVLPRGLRDGVPVLVLVRNDVWKRWMEKE